MSADARIAELGLVLPPAARPIGSYVTYVQTGNLAYTSGHGPSQPDGSLTTGKLGADLDVAAGAAAARATGLALLATLRHELGTLDRVTRIVKLVGMVNCTPDFTEHPQVVNGCSDLLLEVFGEAGRHARSAVGMSSLPLGMAVEIELVVEVT